MTRARDNADLGDSYGVLGSGVTGGSGLTALGTVASGVIGSAVTGFSGIKNASQWRITSTFAGDANPIASNWEEEDAPVGFGILGSSVTESSGIFTFPSTGYWLIILQMRYYASNSTDYVNYVINTTTNNSTYAIAGFGSAECSTGDRQTAVAHTIFDVTDTANCKCNAQVDQQDASNQTGCSTDIHQSGLTFIRLGDT